MSARYLAYALFRYLRLRCLDDRMPFGCSLAPTIQCNLKCEHCYERPRRDVGGEELDVEGMESLARALAGQGIRHCTLTDGEPLLSRESVQKCEVAVNTFWMCYIVTNGTMELVDFPVNYVLSLDGPRKLHDSVRGAGVFDILRENLKASPTDNVYGLCTLSTLNRGHILETVKTAKELGLRGIMFNWHTPTREDDPLWPDYVMRNEDIDQIMRIKASEPEFIYNTRWELETLRTPDWSRSCPAHWVPSYDAFGRLKSPCVFGEGAICERCGCHVFPAVLVSINGMKGTPQSRLAADFAGEYWARDNALIKNVYKRFAGV